MKTRRLQVLWPKLHLPLDSQVFKALRNLKSQVQLPDCVRRSLEKPPYSISRREYRMIQESLFDLLSHWSMCSPQLSEEGLLTSRVELNWLWAGEHAEEHAP
jgi:hypothetical protein